MYSGQLEKSSWVIGVLAWLTPAGVPAALPVLWFSPLMPPHAARNAEAPDTVSPVAPRRRMNSRRDWIVPLAISSNRRSRARSSGICGFPLAVYDEGVLRPPGQLDLAARAQR